ncbi:MAG: hypothetical protein ACI4WS_05735 [Oscillospiraceae bacterium]
MKLTKQERIAVLVIAVIILLVLGVIFFIVPKFEAIGTDSATLVNKQKELSAAVDRAATRDQLGQDVVAAYDEGRNIADMFFEEMQPYEADDEIRNFIQYCKDNGVNIAVDSLDIGSPSVASLGVNFYTEPTVEYDLKTYATQGREATEEEIEAQNRTSILQSALSTNQTVGAIDVSFTVTTLNDEDMLKFVDIVNNYVKQENGNNVRKAIRLSSGYTVTYSEVEKKYAEIAAEILEKSEAEATTQILKDVGEKANTGAAADNTAQNPNNENNEDEDAKDTSFEGNTRQMGVTLVMYSIERMQDPTDLIAAQDAE